MKIFSFFLFMKEKIFRFLLEKKNKKNELKFLEDMVFFNEILF